MLPDEVKTPLDYLEYAQTVYRRKPTRRQLIQQEKAVMRLIKAFGYSKLKNIQLGLEGDDFAKHGMTFVIKAFNG